MSKILINLKISEKPYHLDENGVVIEHDPITLQVIGPKDVVVEVKKVEEKTTVDTQPTAPVAPVASVTPTQPTAPVAPVEPTAPVEPVAPAATVDHVVTQEDLDTNPDLVTQGVSVGDTIQVPADSATE